MQYCKTFILGLAVSGLVPVASLLANTTDTWNGGGSDKRNWNDDANWSTGLAPYNTSIDAVFPALGSNGYGGYIALNGTAYAGSINVNATSGLSKICAAPYGNTTAAYTLNIGGNGGLLFDLPNFNGIFLLGTDASDFAYGQLSVNLVNDGAFRIGGTSNTSAILRVTAAITGNSTLTKAGVGVLELTPLGSYSNTFSDMNIAAGTVRINDTASGSSPLGQGQVTFTGTSTLEYTGTGASVLYNTFALNRVGTFNVTNSAAQLTIGGLSGTYALTKTGSGTLTLNGSASGFTGGINHSAGTLAFASSVTVGSGITLTNGGSASRTVTVNSGITGTVNGSVTSSGTGTVPNFVKAGGGTLVLNDVRLGDSTSGSVTVSAGRLTIAAGGSSRQASKSTGLTVSSGASLDLKNNWYVDEYAGSTSPISTLRGYLTSGRIMTTSTITTQTITGGTNAAGHSYSGGTYKAVGIGIAEQTQANPGSTWHGRTVDATSILMGWAYLGDTNLDGDVDSTDLAHIDHALDTPNITVNWFNGDFNHDNVINSTDLSLYYAGLKLFTANGGPLSMTGGEDLSSTEGGDPAAMSMSASVPEPSSMAALLCGAGLVFSRRFRA